jgi:cytochrome c oxidase assembly protein subunit 15
MKPPRSLRTYIWFVLILNVGVILWGAYVRASGSGAGCGSHWPLCNGVVLPRAPQIETLVEFIHRATSGTALLSVVVLWFWIRRRSQSGQLRTSANWALLFMVFEALIGAGLVLFQLVGQNESVVRAASGALHLANTYLLLGSLLTTGWLASTGRRINLFGQHRLVRWLAIAVVGLILIGSSGAVTALGDTLYPASSLQEGLQHEFTASAHFSVRLRIAHPIIAVLVSILLFTLTRSQSGSQSIRLANAALSLQLVLVIQLLAGVVNWLLLAPIWMQIVHLFLADLALLTFAWWSLEALSTPAFDSQP